MRGNTMRNAFTLIELLVVIAIIAILMALISGAVMKVMNLGPEAVCQNDINQLSVSLTTAQSAFGLDKPFPSLLYLSNDRNDYNVASPYGDLRRDSLRILSSMFPRMDWSQVNWGVPAGGVILEGDQCLVFFLGGPDGLTGFSTNAANPTDPTTATRKGPYFEFPPGRLKAMPAPSVVGVTRSGTAPSFIDGIGKSPYLYFSSGRRKNGYNAYVAPPDSYGSDCRSYSVSPYYSSSSPKRYYNPEKFQIVCAGSDTQFGPGGLYDAASPEVGLLQNGRDDFTNFHASRLEAPE